MPAAFATYSFDGYETGVTVLARLTSELRVLLRVVVYSMPALVASCTIPYGWCKVCLAWSRHAPLA